MRRTARLQRRTGSDAAPLPAYDDEAGWVAVPGLLSPVAAAELAAACDAALAALGDDRRVGDRPVSGTHRLTASVARVPEVAAVVGDGRLLAVVTTILGPDVEPGEVIYRCPQPGFGGQSLHADALPQATAHAPATCATAIVALAPFEPHNGATRVVPGSHRRPDLQRRAGDLDDHPDAAVLTGPAGTAFVFSGHLLHSGTVNRSSRPRPALQITWRRPA